MKKIIIGMLVIALLGGFAFYVFGYSNEEGYISPEELKAEMERLSEINVFPKKDKIYESDYPVVLGKYSENGKVLIEEYFCSDICPDYGRVKIIYEGVDSREECAEIGGKEVTDSAWGGYIGCAPVVE